MDASEIIKAFGGRRAVADIVGTTQTAVSMWKSNGIPARHFIPIARAAEEQGIDGITLDVLAATNPITRDRVAAA